MDSTAGAVVSLRAHDGHQLDGYYCAVPGSEKGIVIIQEIFGINDFVKSMADYWAVQGYQTCAPALFDRASKNITVPYAELKRGFEYLGSVANWEHQLMDIDAAKEFLLQQGVKKVAVIGFCWGGTLAWVSACRLDGLAAASCFYGGSIAEFKNDQPHCPVQMHFGELDTYITSDHVAQIRHAQPQAEIHVYPNAGHGFRCQFRGDYNEPAAQLADQRTQAFLKQYL